MDMLRSEKHHVNGTHVNKISLSPFDSKRWIAANGVDTRAYGHKQIEVERLNEYLFELGVM